MQMSEDESTEISKDPFKAEQENIKDLITNAPSDFY